MECPVDQQNKCRQCTVVCVAVDTSSATLNGLKDKSVVCCDTHVLYRSS